MKLAIQQLLQLNQRSSQNASIFGIGANVNSNRAAVPEAPINSQDVANQQVSSQDATSTRPRGAEARNAVTSRELDESAFFDSDDDSSFEPGANVSVDFNSFNTTVDLTSPAQPVPVFPMGTVRVAPIFRRLSESLLEQDDLNGDMSELTLTSPPVTPPNYSVFLMTQRRNNLGDMTIDLTDSPMAAPVPSASHEQNSLGAAPAPSASAKQNSLGPAPGSTSHIKCPVCLDDLPQITSTRRNLMSTVCGHVFCSSCLPLCIRSNGRCPSCRKALSPNQLHPIFL